MLSKEYKDQISSTERDRGVFLPHLASRTLWLTPSGENLPVLIATVKVLTLCFALSWRLLPGSLAVLSGVQWQGGGWWWHRECFPSHRPSCGKRARRAGGKLCLM